MYDFIKKLQSQTYSSKEAANNQITREKTNGAGKKASNSDQKIRTRDNGRCR